jgi:hypothetical protein
MDIHNRETAGRLGIAIGHRHDRGLRERQDIAQAGLDRERVHERQLRRAGIAENDRDAFLPQKLQKCALSRDDWHASSLMGSHWAAARS